MRTTKLAPLVVIASLALVAAACGSDTSSTTDSPTGASGTAAQGVCASVDTAAGDALANVCESGSLRIATDPKYKPQSWYDVQKGEWNGFDVEVAQEIAKRLGVTSELQAQKWAVITAGSWNDRWDVSVGSMTDTVDREELFYFTPAYYFTPAVMSVANANTSITTPSDLTDKNVCVGVQTTYQDYVQGSLVLGSAAPPFDFQIDGANLQTYDTDTDALDNLALGDGVRCDSAISAQQTIQAFIDDGGAIKIVGDPLYFEPLSIAFDKNAPTDSQSLSEAVDQIVLDMHDDGTLSALSEKWYGGIDWTTSSSESASPSA
ncbi:MAG: transporter substrate-binding domain-containing protein [Actinomycetota bacterium]